MIKEILTFLGFSACVLSVVCMARACYTMKAFLANDGGFNPPKDTPYGYAFAESELYLIASVVEAEAGNQCKLGKQAVAWVIYCRYIHQKGKKTLEDVIYAPHQFAKPAPFVHNSTVEAVREVFCIVDGTIHGEELFPNDLYYFRTKKYHSFGEPYEKIGDHYFSTL